MAPTNKFIEQNKEELNKVIEFFKKELSGLRTGRAQTTLVENIPVEAYGTTTPLNKLAGISVPESKAISIEPWDRSILKDIEKAINYSNLGVSVVNTGERLIAKLPPMTEENRKELIKVMGTKVEHAKVSCRQVRDKIKESIISAEKNKLISEDEKFKFMADLDNYINEYSRQVEKLAEEKEGEIMTI